MISQSRFAERCQEMNAANGAVLVHLIQSINDYIPASTLARLTPTQAGPIMILSLARKTAGLSISSYANPTCASGQPGIGKSWAIFSTGWAMNFTPISSG